MAVFPVVLLGGCNTRSSRRCDLPGLVGPASDLGPRRQDRKRALVFACAGVDVGARGPQPCAVYAGSVGAQEPFSSRQPGFLSLDRQTGALRWILRPEHAETNQMFGFGADAIIGGGRLFAVDLEGVIYAFDDP